METQRKTTIEIKFLMKLKKNLRSVYTLFLLYESSYALRCMLEDIGNKLAELVLNAIYKPNFFVKVIWKKKSSLPSWEKND